MDAGNLQVAWIGTGLMGLPMAGHVLAAGHRLTVFARRPEAVAQLTAAGARLAGSVADAVADADVTVTIVATPADVTEVHEGEAGVLANARPGSVVIDMTTSSPALARRLAAAGLDRGVTVLDAPVSGGPAGAEAGTLSVMVGGDASGVSAARRLLDTFAATVVHQGPAGAGQLTKLVNQTVVAGVTLAACEAHALARAGELDLPTVAESVGAGVAGSALFEFIWSKLSAGDLDPGFKLEHLHKDLRLVIEAAGELEPPGTALAADLVGELCRTGSGELGTQAMVTAFDRGWT